MFFFLNPHLPIFFPTSEQPVTLGGFLSTSTREYAPATRPCVPQKRSRVRQTSPITTCTPMCSILRIRIRETVVSIDPSSSRPAPRPRERLGLRDDVSGVSLEPLKNKLCVDGTDPLCAMIKPL